MKILFYSSIREHPERGVGERLRSLAPAEGVEVCRSIEELIRGIHRSYDRGTIVLLRARDREELLRIVSLRDLLQDLRIILLIPDREEETIALAHRLRPRFLGNGENDVSDTMSVVRRMLEQEEGKSQTR
ncbi:MAG: hypothetical protein JXI32_01670 [Deltaproteobacteria bacterium]|nr:hypothetical protein [Deltaproteobacteria bacterium]